MTLHLDRNNYKLTFCLVNALLDRQRSFEHRATALFLNFSKWLDKKATDCRSQAFYLFIFSSMLQDDCPSWYKRPVEMDL